MYQRTPILYRIADSFFRHRWLFLITVLVVATTTSVIVLKRSEKYVSTTAVQIVPDRVSTDLGIDRSDPWNSPAQQNATAFNEYMQMPSFRQTVLTQLKGKIAAPIDADPQRNDPRLNMLVGGISAYAQTSRLMGINLVWDDPEEAKQLLKAFRDEFVSDMSQERSIGSTDTIKFLDKEIAANKTKMQQAEQSLINYKTLHSGELPEAQSNDIAQWSSLKAQLENMKITADDAALRRAAVMQRMAQIKPILLEQTTGVSPFDNQINDLKVRKEALIASGKLPTHPMVSALADQIRVMERAQATKRKAGASETSNVLQSKSQQNPEYQDLQGQLTQTEIDAKTQKRQMQALQSQIADYDARVRQAPEGQKTLTEKQRDYGSYKARYERLQNSRDDFVLRNKLQKVSALSTYQNAYDPYSQPVLGTTKKAVMLLGSLILGMIVGMVLVVLSEWADRSVRYEGDAEHLLGVPVLAMLPETAELRYLPAPHGSRRNGSRALPDPNAKAEALVAPGGSSRDN